MTAPRGASRSKRRRLAFAAILLVLVWLLCEGLGVLGWWWCTGAIFTPGRAAAARAEVAPDGADAADRTAAEIAARQTLSGNLMLHPFLGYVYPPNDLKAFAPGAVNGPVNRFGFLDDKLPLQKRSPDRFVVAVVGGSFAGQCALLAADVLVEELQKSPALAGRRVELVRLALGGVRQPTQLFAIEYLRALGGEFDCVVNIDGFNEVAIAPQNLSAGIPAHYPMLWGSLVEDKPGPQMLLRAGKLALLREQREEAARAAAPFAWSPLAQVVWLLRDRGFEKSVAAAAAAMGQVQANGLSPAARGPARAGTTLAEALAEMAGVWAQCSIDLANVCASSGTVYCHFLQPNQYVADSKPMGASELQRAVLRHHDYRTGVEQGYPMLLAQVPRMVAAGVDFSDLRFVYRGYPEPFYVDTCCHVNRDGYAVVARNVAARVRRRLDLHGAKVLGIEVPAEVTIADPRQGVPLAVTARLDDGRTYDVTEPAFGTRWSVDDPALLAAGVGGTLIALRRGTTTLRVRHGEHEATSVVTARWPDLLTGEDGVAAPGGVVPKLVFVGDGPVASAVAVECTGMPPNSPAMFAVSHRPLPAAVLTDPLRLGEIHQHQLVSSGPGGRATFTVPVAPHEAAHGRPWFLRVVCLAPAGELMAASNSLVWTPP